MLTEDRVFPNILQILEIFLLWGSSCSSPCVNTDPPDTAHTIWSLNKQIRNYFISCSLYYLSPSQDNDNGNTFLLVYEVYFSAAWEFQNLRSEFPYYK